MPSSGLNLSSVDEAFGEKADLYRDVLKIKSDASTDQVQQAYFHRRDELFQILAKMDQTGVPGDSPKRYQVERQMDGVVMALRVLGDPDARMKYDSLRGDRVTGRLASLPASQFPNTLVNNPSEDDVPLGTGTSVSFSERSDGTRRRRLKSALKKSKSHDDASTRDGQELTVTISKTESIEYIDKTTDEESEEEGPQPAPSSPRKTNSQDDMSRASKTSRNSRRSSKSTGSGSKTSRRGSKSLASKGQSVRSVVSDGGAAASTSSSKRKTRKVTPPRDEEIRYLKSHKQNDNDDASQGSRGSQGTTLTMLESKRSVYEVVKDEIVGALDDTSRSFEQVFGAFTLQEEEIKAVFGRIDKAKRQMENEFTA